jgi:uncharacterized protein YbaP (TraB family)
MQPWQESLPSVGKPQSVRNRIADRRAGLPADFLFQSRFPIVRMIRLFAALLFLPCLSIQAQDSPPPPAASADTVLDAVLVTGEQPGPGLWRVSKGDHDLWILGSLDPLPKKMSWRAKETEEVIARSQAVLAPPAAELNVGFFKSLTLVPSLLRARKNTDKDKLVDVLPPELYARWLILKQKYIGRDEGVEKFRPMFAAHELFMHALDKSGLATSDIVWGQVKKIAKKDKVEITPVTVKVELEDPKSTIKQFEQTPREADINCLRTTIERLETDLQGTQQRANLWASGDVPGLRAITYPDQIEACIDAATAVPELRKRADALRAQVRTAWVNAAVASLEKNKSTFAVLPIARIAKTDGWLTELREKGYEIEEP